MQDEWKKYWSIYERIEKEVSDITFNIYLCDEHLDVYSIHIAELLLRIGAECENIIKSIAQINEITIRNKNMKNIINELCATKIEFQTKEVTIIWDYSFVSNKIIKPFDTWNNQDSRNPNWYKAYNDIKHNRNDVNIKSATYKNIIYGMAGLFVLNLYLRKKDIEKNVYWIERAREEIFSFSDFFLPESFLKLSENGGIKKHLMLETR